MRPPPSRAWRQSQQSDRLFRATPCGKAKIARMSPEKTSCTPKTAGSRVFRTTFSNNASKLQSRPSCAAHPAYHINCTPNFACTICNYTRLKILKAFQLCESCRRNFHNRQLPSQHIPSQKKRRRQTQSDIKNQINLASPRSKKRPRSIFSFVKEINCIC